MQPDPNNARLFVDADLAPGTRLELAPGQAHYLDHVLRLRAGAAVALFNGRDGEWLGRIDSLKKGRCRVTPESRTRRQASEPDLWLVFAPIKRGRIDFLAEKATELGVRRLWPVFTRRTSVRRVNTRRLRANATEAAEQSGRLSVPEVADPVSLDTLVGRWPAARRLLVLDESGASPPIAEVLSRGAAGRPAPDAILTGPEGGFERSELDALKKLPFVSAAGMGGRILRADTAALSALACWQALLGDWR